MRITKTGEFCAAHHLPHYQGECANNHGHTWHYRVEIEAFAFPDLLQDGILFDFAYIDKETRCQFHHQDLNEFFENPTCEIIALEICNRICKYDPQDKWDNVAVTVWESDSASVTVTRADVYCYFGRKQENETS